MPHTTRSAANSASVSRPFTRSTQGARRDSGPAASRDCSFAVPWFQRARLPQARGTSLARSAFCLKHRQIMPKCASFVTGIFGSLRIFRDWLPFGRPVAIRDRKESTTAPSNGGRNNFRTPATTLLVSVEPCQNQTSPRPRPLRPPRCLPSVEPCSRPDVVPITASSAGNTAPRWQAAWWRSNGFLGGFASGLEHRSRWRAAWWRSNGFLGGFALVLNTAPRWQAAWWRSNGFLGGFALVLNTVPRWRAAW